MVVAFSQRLCTGHEELSLFSVYAGVIWREGVKFAT